MVYKRADSVLPDEIIKLIQEYVDGVNLYIPRKDGERKEWGSNTRTRQEMISRNSTIKCDYNNGVSISELAEKYFLSEKSIQRIVYSKA